MDGGTWQALVYGVARVGHDLVTRPPPPLWSEDWECVCVRAQLPSPVCLFATPWTAAQSP